MIQLAFQPAYDPFHAIFRYFRIRSLLDGRYELDRYRIIDYYICFPDELADFRFSPKHRRFRSVAEHYAAQDNFERRPSKILILSRMRLMQMAALQTLEREGYLVPGALAEMKVVPSGRLVPDPINERVEARANTDLALLEVVGALATEYDLVGPNGLKARSNLLEHKYDAV